MLHAQISPRAAISRTTGRPAPPISWFMLGLLLAAATVASLLPLALEDAPGAVLAKLRAAIGPTIDPPVVLTLLERLVVFVPLGFLVHWIASNRLAADRWLRPTRAAMLVVGVFAALLEVGQAFMAGRHARLTDWLIALAAGFAGARLSRRLLPFRPRWLAVYERNDRLIAAGLLLVGNLAVAGLVGWAHAGVRLAGWDSQYPVVVGNELNGGRLWRGQIHGLAFYARVPAADEIRELARVPFDSAGVALRRRAGAIGLYAFLPDGSALEERIRGEAELALVVPGEDVKANACAGGALTIEAPDVIRSAGPAARIAQAVMAADALAVECLVAPAQSWQGGPARIVSISQDAAHRNVTVGQQGDAVDFRFRTRRTGPNGSAVRCRSRQGVLGEGRHHVMTVCSDGEARIWVDGAEARRPLRLYRVSVVLFRHDYPVAGMAAGGLLFLPLGIIAAVLLVNVRAWMAWPASACLAGLIPLGLSIATSAVLDRPQDPVFIVSGAAFALAGAAWGRAACLRANNNRDPGLVW
ncbi:MAG TPA: VanZ family protein [Phycisphaerae bacterium]|jgi:VanZ family protein|nr:VanZ family protein [Phycisphaerae bacterium]HOB73486.1 VanZ family protein [Phycisphaerae bacterium]HOJ54094.1 VanZ family protein [Phycisphaerae bacterium]HOL25613.1 VanZ family protein [Phycisphaerae bacterium]HPP22750.1 VanZ family protein [Phycisphaerae bacterium]